MDVGTAIERMGGIATRAQLIRATSRAEVDRALRDGTLQKVAHGRYAVTALDRAVTAAHAVNGVLSLTSAALFHGWEVKTVPAVPHVVVPRRRVVPDRVRGMVQLHRAELGPDDVSGKIATSRELTLTQCARSLPDDEALAVLDSALRHGEHAAVARVMAAVRGAGSAKVRRIAAAAREDAANPFESTLRAICLQVPGLRVEPQVVIASERCWARPDLVDRELRIVVEADSFEWHGSRHGLRRDARRYNLLVAEGWLVLRFTWEDVMFEPDYVRDVLARVVGCVDPRTELPAIWPLAA